MPLHLPPELERRIVHLAAQMHREPQAALTELLGAALDEDSAFPDDDEGEGSNDEEAGLGAQPPLPHDWNDYLRYRFEEGRAAMARGDYSETPPAELMARVRARVEKNPWEVPGYSFVPALEADIERVLRYTRRKFGQAKYRDYAALIEEL
jgi:hypothetical protein